MKPAPITTFGLKQLELIAGRTIDTANAKSALLGLETYGFSKLGLNRPHRLAQYLAQIMHESARFRHDRELWGPTPAQKRYDTRTDLGNTAAADGDGKKYMGRTAGQITGKANYAEFTRWARKIDHTSPDFVKDPDAINTDPWEGLGFIWFWEARGLNGPSDAGDVHRVTRIVNGGYNGIDDRLELYARAALVLLGYHSSDVMRFQMDNGLKVDGVAGPATRAVLHRSLVLSKPLQTGSVASKQSKPPTLRTPGGYGIIAIIGAALAWLASKFIGG